jgi:pimeloyl-ACP methyl ester carboxylesterase
MKNGVAKKVMLTIALLVAVATTCRAQMPIVGDWQGTLNTGQGELRLVLHISKAQDGSLSATLDSVDQAANGIPVTAISLKDSKLKLTIDAVHGSYGGTVNKDATEIKGTWSQGPSLDLNFKRMAASLQKDQKPVPPSDIDGTWMGALDLGGVKLRMVFHITNTADGLTATADSPDQNATGMPVTAVTRNGSSLKFEMKQLGGVFDGKISEIHTTIAGTWSQRGNTIPLVLKLVKDKAELERRRPQNPARPYPYQEVEVAYDNKLQGNRLAGTLTIPSGKGPFPAVLLITGSGPQDRDESLMGHKPFLVLSDWLTRKGIVVLRVDDRGVGKSTGDFAAATTADFATDAEAGVAFLKTRSEVDLQKIGLIGHSEGGIIAPMVAARSRDVGFIVIMAGSGVPGDQILVEQSLLISEAGGAGKDKAENYAAKERELLALVMKETDEEVLKKELREKLADELKEPQLGAQIKAITSPWFRYFLAYDPATALRHVTCPVLALSGEKDLQVPPGQNLPAIRKALVDGGNKYFEVDELPGLNHLFQTAKTGAPSEYSTIEETISPLALEKISSWILKLANA